MDAAGNLFLVHLILWVDHKRPPVALSHQDAILCRNSVTRQTFCIPLADDILITKNVNQAKSGTDWDVQVLALRYPLVN